MGQAVRKFEVVEGGCSIASVKPIEQPIGQPLGNLEKWLSVADLVGLSDVSPQAVKKAVSSRRWRGADLIVRQVEVGRGGAGGMAPQVHVDSLPADLREAWYLARGVVLHARPDAVTGEVREIADNAMTHDPHWEARAALARWRLDMIRRVLSQPKGSAARKAEIDALIGREITAPNGTAKVLTKSTLYNWVSAYDAEGLAGLMTSQRKDKGQRRVGVTLAWDQFFAGRISAADHQQVSDDLTHYIRSMWRSGASGWRTICEKSTTRLIEMTRDLRDLSFDTLPIGRLGDAGDMTTQFGVCAVSARRVRDEKQFKVLAIRDKDNAVYQDTIVPSIRRDYSQLKPREIVVGDVHPLDIMVRRANGRPAYPKAISWFDVATGEVHMTIVLLEEREGIRREHVAMSFQSMVSEWGLPKLLYLDNGSEYKWAEMIDGFTALSKLAGMTVKEMNATDARVAQSEEAAVRSIAFNAKGKPGIEGLFGNLERVFFSHVPGWTAGERMRKKTHAKGRDPIPFPGDMKAFFEVIRMQLEDYHARPARESRKSPNEMLRAHIDAGWGKTVLKSPEVLELALSTEIERVVDGGCVTYAPRDGRSQRYYCDGLLGLVPGTRITCRVPAYDPKFLFCFGTGGELIGIARPETKFHPLDPAGVHELNSRSKALRRYMREQSRNCALLDLLEETSRHLEHLPEAPEAPVAAVVDAGMLDRMAQIEADERARIAAADRGEVRREPSQWGYQANAALENHAFLDEDEE